MAEKINITFLGTSGAKPSAKRNHTGILISYAAENILFDCGEGIQRQFKIAKENPCKLTRIFLTHWHGDHVLGLPGLLESLEMSEYSKTLHIYGPKNTKEKIALLEKVYGKFNISIQIHEVSSGTIVKENGFSIESHPMSHGIATNAYSFIVPDKLRLDKSKLKKLKLPNSPLISKLAQGKDIIHEGKKIKAKSLTYMEKGKKISLVLDTLMNPNALKISKNSDILICESTFLANSPEGEKLAKEHNHLTSKDAATLAKRSKVKTLILTHLSERYEHDPKPLLDEAKNIFKNTLIAKDFDKIQI